MGLNFFKWLAGTNKTEAIDVKSRELFAAAEEFQIRELSFWVCVNMIANALGRCEFRTFRNNEEVQEREYYLWNISPNVNQSSSAFLHKLVAKLYADNEVLVVDTLPRGELSSLVVADNWVPGQFYPSRQNEYSNVSVEDFQFNYPFYENAVLHLTLNHTNMRPVINAMYDSYARLVSAAIRAYTWQTGQHWKVHVSQLAQGGTDFAEKFQAMITEQMKPFIESAGAVLPEFDGYAYENVGAKSTSEHSDTRDIKAMIEDVFDFTARGFLIPSVLVKGSVEGTADANSRFLTNCIDPLADQLQEEINRKRYGYDGWKKGNYVRIDTSSIIHFDMFANAANVEKLVGSGAYTINDVRRAANQAPINEPWADQSFMTLNISPLNETAGREGN